MCAVRGISGTVPKGAGAASPRDGCKSGQSRTTLKRLPSLSLLEVLDEGWAPLLTVLEEVGGMVVDERGGDVVDKRAGGTRAVVGQE